jgi:hypothetical protein
MAGGVCWGGGGLERGTMGAQPSVLLCRSSLLAWCCLLYVSSVRESMKGGRRKERKKKRKEKKKKKRKNMENFPNLKIFKK